ncbi:MAG: hypothetical protein KGJ10_01495 [Acidobacteriota bacterium]|nr:hypothetical protein [Acidobacteriota bacterium]MDE3043484.1 hypothetical protein [Acidobacteriota bacterium]MDE3106803.1 hypothetical protein [Acidobacteriota bacterium]
MATHARTLSRRATVWHGLVLTLYVVLVPYVVAMKWRASAHAPDASLLRGLLVVLGVLWIGFLAQVGRNVIRLRQGREVGRGASAWLAGLLVALASFFVASHESPAPYEARANATSAAAPTRAPTRPLTLASAGALPMALAAKRRADQLRHDDPDDAFADTSIALLRHARPEDLARLATVMGHQREGSLASAISLQHVPPSDVIEPTVVLVVDDRLYFAREGGQLLIPRGLDRDELAQQLVALHHGAIRLVRDETELLRALATRHLHHTLVVFLGPNARLDDDLAASCVTLVREEDGVAGATAAPARESGPSICVELLRAEPTIVGLAEPFVATLRRRCVEMTSYLALHRHEPVTGERLRTRVLVHADVDASQRTLANTASAVRRSLGVDERGPRLHPVSASGLYVTHGLTSDVEHFSEAVSRARQLDPVRGARVAREALALVKGEVLASALRGFEWFLAEGHQARLARDGEWAALLVHHDALRRGDFDVAFWALQQGLLIDPYSDALREALVRVPRLREFGGDRTSRPQHQSVGAEGAVAMSWALTGLSKQIFQ